MRSDESFVLCRLQNQGTPEDYFTCITVRKLQHLFDANMSMNLYAISTNVWTDQHVECESRNMLRGLSPGPRP